jgi:thiol-disulfide isomerase/thioredoxin
MKNLLLSLISFLIVLAASGKEKSGYSIIKGKLSLEKLPTEMSLYSVANGDVVLHSKVKVNKDGTFGFCFVPEKAGIYRIGERNSPARIYVMPGKEYSFTLTSDGLEVLNKSDRENQKMVEWASIIWKIKKANMLTGNFTYKDIFPVIPDVEKDKDAFVAGLNTGNKLFDTFMKGMVQSEFEKELYHFLFMPRTEHPDYKMLPDIYSKVSSGEHFTSTKVLDYDFGQSAISMYLQFLLSMKSKEGIKYSPEITEKLCLENIKNDTLKGWYFLNNQLLRARTFDQVYRDKVEKYKKYIVTEEQKNKLYDFELTIRKMGDGEPGINFEGTTVDGKKVTFSEFKGKVVLVDVWATWCGPCKKEIPALKQLEEEMHGKDVVFVSYSVDKPKDLEKWKKFVADEKLGGVQLFGPSDFSSPICIDYKINAIPRFLVFDRKGNIVTIDAPRPSAPELKTLLNKYL